MDSPLGLIILYISPVTFTIFVRAKRQSMISLKPRKMLLRIKKNLLSATGSLTGAVSGRLALGPGEPGTGGAKALPNAFPRLNTISIFSIAGNTLVSLK